MVDVEDLNLSADGMTVAGTESDSGDLFEAYRWTASEGVELLEFPPGAEESRAFDISADGQVVAGNTTCCRGTGLDDAAIWDEINGWQNVEEILIGAGVDISGWQLKRATAISANGRVIAGEGINPSGRMEAWLAVIAIPEPSTISICWILVVLSFARRVRR